MKIKIVNLIVFLVYFYLPIDTLNGILIRNLHLSISPVYKMFILGLMIFYLTKKKILIPFYWTIFFILIFIFHLILGILTSLELFWGLKFLAIVISFYFFKTLVQSEHLQVINKLAFISVILIALNIFIGLLGYGYAQYSTQDIGTRGLFYAGNELGVLLLVTSMIILSNSLVNKNIRRYLLYSFLFIFFAAMLTTKTAVLGQVLIICILPVIELFVTKKGFILKKHSLKLAGFGFFVMLVLLPVLIYFVLYEMNLIQRLSYWAGRVDFVTLFFSGRNISAEKVLEYIKNHANIFGVLTGFGNAALIKATGNSVEIDIVDLFMLFGLIGVIAIYGFFVGQFIKNSSPINNTFRPYVLFGIWLLLLLSCMSGHVLNSGMAGILIGAFLSLQYYLPAKTYE